MLKPYRKLIVVYFLILWGIFVVYRILRAAFTGEVVDFSVLATGTLWIIVFTAVYWAYLVKRFKPRLDYIEGPETEFPDFPEVVMNQVEWKREDFPLERLRDELAARYVVTYIGKQDHIIKIRSRFTMRSWGACSVIRWQPEQEVVKVASYPMANHTVRQGREGERQNDDITRILQWMQTKREESKGF